MADKIKLDDYFKRNEIHGQICNSPKDYAICEKINQEMESVRKEAVVRFNHSRNSARHLILRSHGRST